MTSLTQFVVGKDIPNSLIAEDLLKILRYMLPLSPPKSLINSHSLNSEASKEVVIVSLVKNCKLNVLS